jgi:Copper type II ascorbate-dependent monooxygenase, C-terminal domain
VKDRLGLIQFYDPYIVVPAHADAVAQMRCKVPADITLVRSTTHEHLRGTKVESFLDAVDGTPAATPFLTSTNWDQPDIRTDEIKVGSGQYIRTVCHYTGDEHPMVVQGQYKGDKEMCMTIAYYYPVIADPQQQALFENCIQTPLLTSKGVVASYGDSYGTGTAACQASLTCVQGVLGKDATEAPNPHDGQIDVGPNFQKCIVDSCASASTPLFTMLNCVRANCKTECADPSKCQPCVIDKCSSELTACQAHTCP